MKDIALYLTYVDDNTVEFDAYIDDIIRKISVRVGGGMVLFPHIQNESGETLGNPYDDHNVRLRAHEELTRLRCYRSDAA